MPSTFETETVVIADLIAAPDLIPEAQTILRPELFEDYNSRRAWEILQDKLKSGEAIDLTTVGTNLDQTFFTKHLLPKIISSTGSGAFVAEHCRTLSLLHSRKLAYQAGIELVRQSSTASEDMLIGIVEALKTEITNSQPESGTVSAISAVNTLFDNLQSGGAMRITSGLTILDTLTGGGFTPGQLIILAARPSVGKTALALQMAQTSANAGFKTTFYSLEMTSDELAERLLISIGKVSRSSIDQKDWPALEEAASGIPERLQINDRLSSLDRIIADMTLANRSGQLDAVFIDYLGLIAPLDPKALPVHDLANRTRRLKQAAKQLGVPIVLLSQLNRNSATEGRPPQLFDLRDSGGIEQDADLVLMLESVANTESEYPDLNLWVRKNRQGKRDIKIRLSVSNQYTVFRELGYE